MKTIGIRCMRHLKSRWSSGPDIPGMAMRQAPRGPLIIPVMGATHREPIPHAASLGCVERVKEFVGALRLEPYARILHREAPMVVVTAFSSDKYLPRTILDAAHRV